MLQTNHLTERQIMENILTFHEIHFELKIQEMRAECTNLDTQKKRIIFHSKSQFETH